MPWPLSAANSGPRRLSQAHGITETCRNSQPTCSAASCSSPADRLDVQSQASSTVQCATPALLHSRVVPSGLGEASQAHQTDEFCAVETIAEAALLYQRLIERWCRL